MQLRFETTLKSLNRDKIKYIGRSPQAAAATGYMSVHLAELDAFLTEAMN